MRRFFRVTVLVSMLGTLAACGAAAPLPSPPTGGATPTVSAFTPTPPAVSASSTPARPTLPAQPRGITAVSVFEPIAQAGGRFIGQLFDERTYANPNVAGLTFRTSWADIEPAADHFNWAKLDTVFDNAERNSKWVELVLIPGFGTPDWARQGVATSTFIIPYSQGKGDELVMPLPWDQTYLNRWFAFLKSVSDRYQSRPSFLKIAADGPTSLTGEMTLPDSPADLCNWIKLGYTSERLIDAWKLVFANYAQIFPRQYFSLALYPPLPIVSTTRCENGKPVGDDRSESTRVRDALIELGVDHYPRQFVLQENGLRAVRENISPVDELIKSYSSRIVTGYQLTTSAMSDPMLMGNVADGATALRNSLQKGVDDNAQFLEVYEADVLHPAAQNVLADVASALAKIALVGGQAGAVPQAPTLPATTSTPTASLKLTRGIFIVTGHNVAIQPATYTNPAVDGIVIRTFWSNVQPAPDQFDWTFIDSQVQAASTNGKKVILLVLPGAFTPQWALQGVQSAQFVVDYGFMQGATVTLPMPWDATYLKRWFAFVRILAQRYDSNPAVVNVPATGPTSISEEMSLPKDPAALAKWKQLGYSVQKYESAWQDTLATYSQSFPTTQISLAFYPGLPIPNASAETAPRVDVAGFAFTNYAQHMAFQENGLSARKASAALGYELVQQYSAQTTTGFEMGTSATEKPDQMGGTTPASALQASVDLGLKAGIKFLVIYEKDELNPDLQSILVNAHSALTR